MAEAVGIKLEFDDDGMPGFWKKEERSRKWLSWNPIANLGDAMAIAVKKKINIEFVKKMSGEFVEVCASPSGRGDCIAIVSLDENHEESTCMAIVQATLNIAKSGRP